VLLRLKNCAAASNEDTKVTSGGEGGPCYRCLYPRASPTEGCKSCSDNGVLGTVPGLIGLLQATEVLKLLSGIGPTLHSKMIMYDSMHTSFMSITKPTKRKLNCAVCGNKPTITSMDDSYAACMTARGPTMTPAGTAISNSSMKIASDASTSFNANTKQSMNITAAMRNNSMGNSESLPTISIFPSEAMNDIQSTTCLKFHTQIQKNNQPYLLLDVRVKRQYELCSLPNSVHIPLAELTENLNYLETLSSGTKPLYCVCRRGIASKEATQLIQSVINAGDHPGIHSVCDLEGGLTSWTREVDATFPLY